MSPARLPYTASRKVSVVGPDQVTSPFPVRVAGTVIKGFGRGSKQLGFPTANLPLEVVEDLVVKLEGPGIYYGWAKVADSQVLPMVMSIGWNPYYQNEKPSAEIYIIHKFDQDFYGKELRAVVLGFIRPELDYPSLDALVEDINKDVKVTLLSLDRPNYRDYSRDVFFLGY